MGTSSTLPRCSVIIPTYNRMRLLGLTLEALTRQDLGTDAFEVLVVDDGSSDASADVAAAYAARLNLRYFRQADEGYRVAKARNVGIAHAQAPVCVFVDSGVLLHSGALTAFLRRHARPEPVAAIGYVYCFNLDNEDAGRMVEELDFADVDLTVARLDRDGAWLDVREDFYARYGEALHELPAPWLEYWTCNASADTALLRRVGGFDEAFRSWGTEDIELGYRLFRAGARFELVRDARAIHHPHPKALEDNRRSQAGNLRYMASKHDTPIVRLLVAEPPVYFSDINDHIREHGVPSCEQYLARAGGRA